MMKKILLAATILMIGSTTIIANNGNKKNNKKQPVQKEVKIKLNTHADSISYAAGMTMTRGLERYITEQLGVKPSQMADFMRGLKEGLAMRKDATFAGYATGLQIAQQLEYNMFPSLKREFKDNPELIDEEIVYKGFMDAMKKDTTHFTQQAAEQLFQSEQYAIKEAKDQANKQKGEKFLAENKNKPGVVTLESGLQYKVLTQGTGDVPTLQDRVMVVYEGKTIDGKVFDATVKHGTQYDVFGVSGLIKGWTEALTLMPVGSKWELYIPQELAYGARGAGNDILPYSALIFTLELQGIDKPVEEQKEIIADTVTPKSKTNTANKKNKTKK